MSYISERLSRIRSAVAFLDHSKQFISIKDQAAEFYNLKGCLVYNFNIIVDLGIVYDHDAALGENILSSPLESTSIFQEIVFQFCHSHQLLSPETTPTQICARLRIVGFPSGCDSFCISSVTSLNKCIDYLGFVLVTGVIVGLSGSAKYTQSTKYICPEELCEGSQGNHFIRMHIPGASEKQTIRNDFTCTFCGNILVEVTSLRSLSDKMLVEVAPIPLVGPSQKEVFKAGRLQPIPIFVRDELLNLVRLGDACQVIGITRTDVDGETIDVTLEANNISLLTKNLSGFQLALPDSVQAIFDSTRQSPWSFPLNMAYHFGDTILPCGAMIKLRLLHLISLVLNPKQHPLHILVLGRETSLIMSLCQHALKFSQRSFPAMIGTPISGRVTADSSYKWAPYFIHAGILPLCSGGVCLCGDLGSWKKQQREQLQAILSGGKIFFDLPSKHKSGLSHQQTLSLQCHVWGVFSTLTSGSKVTGHNDDVMCGGSTGDLSKSFLDYICFLDGGNSFTDEEIYTQTCYHYLTLACVGGSRQPDIKQQDMDLYLTIARQLEPVMTSAAETLIQSYYSAVRLARSSGLGGSDVPVSGVASLLSLATGFAKLRLSREVQETDAVMAAFLYEESLVSRLGLSVLILHPQPHISESFIPEFLGKENDLAMQKFQVQLLKFCSRVFDNRSARREE